MDAMGAACHNVRNSEPGSVFQVNLNGKYRLKVLLIDPQIPVEGIDTIGNNGGVIANSADVFGRNGQ